MLLTARLQSFAVCKKFRAFRLSLLISAGSGGEITRPVFFQKTYAHTESLEIHV